MLSHIHTLAVVASYISSIQAHYKYIYMNVQFHIYIHACIHTRVLEEPCPYVYVSECVRVCVCVCVCVGVFIHTLMELP